MLHNAVLVSLFLALVSGAQGTTSGTNSGAGAAQVSRPMIRVVPSDTHLQYTGRWDLSNPKQAVAGWQGSSLKVQFRGRSVEAELDAGIFTEYFRAIVDGDVLGSVKFPVAPGRANYVLASGLVDGVHTVELIKETYAGTLASFFGLAIDGTGILPPPPRPQRRIEFYGDSNLAGVSLEDERNKSDNNLVGSTLGYAGIVARMFGAEYHNISASGETISSLHNRYDRIDWGKSQPKWDFNEFVPDLVVVNLGANDVGKPVSQIKNDYNALLDDLRSVHPNAHIMLYNAYGWDFNEPANYTAEVIAARSDPNMSSAVFPWLFEQFHGCQYDHGGMAQVLAGQIGALLGWTPGTADVMSGFGIGGDVANGGFEQIAPFGGFGWRYITTQGVTRVIDAMGSFEGMAYVRLLSQASIHQPNPAVGGDTVTASLWLRAGSAGQTVDVSLDFRDQQLYSPPLQTSTTTFVLGTDWQLFVVSDVAPTLSNPVFQTRLTITAGPASQVDVDGISMSVN